VVHVWEGRFYRLDAHLDRFAASMARLRLDPGHDRAAIEDILHGCVRHAGLRAAYVSMTCTRGRMPPGSRDLRTARSMFYCYARSLIELARAAGQRVDEGLLTAADLLRADEVLVTSTAGGIMPVTVVDGRPVGTGTPGPLTRNLRDLYWASHQDPRYSAPVRY
jgi:branched-subunit amino acid aminotransferase/4-amino-4-deoxychorismate lyase